MKKCKIRNKLQKYSDMKLSTIPRDITHKACRTVTTLIISFSVLLLRRLFAGAAGIMNTRLHVGLLLFLAVGTVTVLAQRRRPAEAKDAWNYRDGCEHPDYSLFTLGQRSSAGLVSKSEVKDDAVTNV